MKGLWQATILVVMLALTGCPASDIGGDPPDPIVKPDPNAPCTDATKCCAKDQMKCIGDPDGRIICTCSGLWDCSKNPKKCEAEKPVPPGGGTWDCTWTEFKYTCKKGVPPPGDKGTNPQDLPGGGDWVCKWNDKEFAWECSKNPPNPPNNPSGPGVWKCTVQGTLLVCERTDTPPPPIGSGKWTCTPDKATGKVTCKKDDNSGGLPPGGGNWKCNKTVNPAGVPTWVCYGDSDTPPGGGGWVCVKVENEFNKWKCEKPDDSSDVPPGGGWYACVKGSEFGGTLCQQVPKEPTPPTPTPKPGDACAINEKMWCDGLQYCGWGQVKCDPKTGKWETVVNNGQVILNCQELATGERPNTVCACYHFFYNPSCCERPDCIVPSGTNGQICPISKGKLCDYCNPLKPECNEPQAKCIVTNSHETFCGRLCSAATPCPNGYQCLVVKLQAGQITNQCVPADFSCYY